MSGVYNLRIALGSCQKLLKLEGETKRKLEDSPHEPIAHLAGLAEENVVNVLQPPFNWYAVGRILSLLRGGAAAAVHGEVLFK